MPTRLQIFTRVPKLGKVKTRLEPFLGQEGCLTLHRCLIAHALNLATGWNHGPVEFWFAVPDTEPKQIFDSEYMETIRNDLQLPTTVSLQIQQGNNLGGRIQFALESALGQGDSSILIGTDCPEQSLSHLDKAYSCIQGQSRLVIQPATDGGFVLIGCSALLDLEKDIRGIELYKGIDWGTDQVLMQLEKRLQNKSLAYDKIVTISDLDTEEDFLKLQADSHSFVDHFYKSMQS